MQFLARGVTVTNKLFLGGAGLLAIQKFLGKK